jgi:homospermidine synthase
VWAIENPAAGVVEADQLDHVRVLDVAVSYLGEMAGAYSDWTPIKGRGVLFAEEVDASCQWQFGNFRVA